MPLVVDRGREVDLRHFLLGSTPQVLHLLERSLRDAFPGVRVVGSYAPPFGDGLEGATTALALVRAAQPQLVWCAFGAPKQELWMSRNAENASGAVFVGVGAAFDFLAGTKRRAPRWMQDSGLEWMHRFATEPRRLGRRYLTTNAEFIGRTGLELALAHLAERTEPRPSEPKEEL